MANACPDKVCTGVAHKISKLTADIANITLFIRKVINRHIGHYGQMFILVQDGMEIAEEQTSYFRSKWKYRSYTFKVKFVKANRYVLKRIRIIVGRIYLHAGIVISNKIYSCPYTPVTA